MGSVKKKILILAANPKATEPLRFGEEMKKIPRSIRSSKHRDDFLIEMTPAIDYDTLLESLLNFFEESTDSQPYIIHFIGHGETDQLIVEDGIGYPDPVSPDVFTDLLKLCSNHTKQLECIIFSACNSENHASDIIKHVNYAIGMNNKIKDDAAIRFASGFYTAIGNRMSIENSFRIGCNFVNQAFPNESQHSIPVLKYDEIKTGPIVPPDDTTKKKNRKTLISISIAIILFMVIALFVFTIWEGVNEKTAFEPKTSIKDTEFSTNHLSDHTKKKNKEDDHDYNRSSDAVIDTDSIDKRSNNLNDSKTAFLLEELKEKGLLKKLKDADAHCHGGSITSEDTALDLYREVIENLSPDSLQALNQTLLINAENNYINNNDTHALRSYNAVFKEVISGPNPPDATKRAAYLDVGTRTQSPNVEFDIKKHIVNLNARSPVPSGFWMEFRNDQITWADYDTIQLKVDYDEDTQFDQSAMLKLQLNGITLSPSSVKPNTIAKEPFLFKSKGIFYYRFKRDQLHENNFVTIALNKGQWTNFSIELTLIKKNETKK